MSENINNTPENNQNYLDYIVEDDIITLPKRKFSVTKLLSMIFGILSGLILLYYAVEVFVANNEQLKQYADMGITLPIQSLLPGYLTMAFLFVMGICPIVGGLLPRRYAKLSVFFLAIPVAHTVITFLPQLVSAILYKAPFSEAYQTYLFSASAFLSLAGAIIGLFVYDDDCCCCCDDAEFEFYEYEDEEDEMEFEEIAEETVQEETVEEETVETAEEITEKAEEKTEE